MSEVEARDLKPGDVISLEIGPLEMDLEVSSVEKTGSVKFGEVGPDAVPMVRVYFIDMPKPFKGTMEVAGDQKYNKIATWVGEG